MPDRWIIQILLLKGAVGCAAQSMPGAKEQKHGLPVACHTVMSKMDMRLVTNVLHHDVIRNRKVPLIIHDGLDCHILCTHRLSVTPLAWESTLSFWYTAHLLR